MTIPFTDAEYAKVAREQFAAKLPPGPPLPLLCLVCGREMRVSRFKARQGRGLTCSARCRGSWAARERCEEARKLAEAAISEPFLLNGQLAARITLTTGEHALIDAGDVELVRGQRWCLDRHRGGYVRASSGRGAGLKADRLHRLIMQPGPGEHVDHRHHNPLDNRRSELRLTTPGQNAQNLRGGRANSRTGMRGVYRDGRSGRYYARLRLNGRYIFGGRFDTPQEADLAAKELRRRHMTHAPECEVAP